MALPNELRIEKVEHCGLTYVSDSTPGISRRLRGSGFSYSLPNGSSVQDPKQLDRIRKLAIPPAYRSVWICPDENGYLQATGVDARGRKQYLYHPDFRAFCDDNKFEKLSDFGRMLPSIRKRVDHDLMRRGLPKEKVLAVVLYLLEVSLIRIGNERYAKDNQSFGLTTMRTRHVKISGQSITFKFLGKSKKTHLIEIHDRRLSKVVKKIQELPGQELFHYLDDDGHPQTITSHDVNQYLSYLVDRNFTAKTFRTWWGTVLAFIELSQVEAPTSESGAKRSINRALKAVSERLGNTVSVCRKSYVHPIVFEKFREGKLANRLEAPECSTDIRKIHCTEEALLHLLSSK